MHQVVGCQLLHRQGGAALLVALVLVLVSTLLGVSAMQSSDMETQMANNTRYQQTTFRVAEAAADSLLTLPNIVTLVNDPTSTVSTTESIDSDASVSADFIEAGEGPATGFSLGGQNGFRTLNFISRATASIDAVDSTSGVVQGISRLTPSRGN